MNQQLTVGACLLDALKNDAIRRVDPLDLSLPVWQIQAMHVRTVALEAFI